MRDIGLNCLSLATYQLQMAFFMTLSPWPLAAELPGKGKNQNGHSLKLQNMEKVRVLQLSVIFQGTYEAIKF